MGSPILGLPCWSLNEWKVVPTPEPNYSAYSSFQVPLGASLQVQVQKGHQSPLKEKAQ